MNVTVCNVSKGRDELGACFMRCPLSAFFCFLFYNLARGSTTFSVHCCVDELKKKMYSNAASHGLHRKKVMIDADRMFLDELVWQGLLLHFYI